VIENHGKMVEITTDIRKNREIHGKFTTLTEHGSEANIYLLLILFTFLTKKINTDSQVAK